MCIDCWKSYDEPRIINDFTRKIAKAISKVYKYHCTGGHLHIVIDDWNLDNESVSFCRDYIDKNKFKYSAGQIEAEKECVTLLILASIEERASALAIQRGYIDRG